MSHNTVPTQRVKREQLHWHPCSLTACRTWYPRANAGCAVALTTQISAVASVAVPDARVHEPAHWLCTDESRPPRFESLRNHAPTPEKTPVTKSCIHHPEKQTVMNEKLK